MLSTAAPGGLFSICGRARPLEEPHLSQGYQYYTQGGSVSRSGGSTGGGYLSGGGIASLPLTSAGVVLPNGQIALVRTPSSALLVGQRVAATLLRLNMSLLIGCQMCHVYN